MLCKPRAGPRQSAMAAGRPDAIVRDDAFVADWGSDAALTNEVPALNGASLRRQPLLGCASGRYACQAVSACSRAAANRIRPQPLPADSQVRYVSPSMTLATPVPSNPEDRLVAAGAVRADEQCCCPDLIPMAIRAFRVPAGAARTIAGDDN